MATAMRPRAGILGLTLLVFLLSGCAHYTTSSGLIGGIRSVAIPLAENDTAEPDISEILTERATEAFTVDGRLRVVDEESADAILFLRLVEAQDRPFTFTAGEETEQYRFRAFVDADLVRAAHESSLLELVRLSGWGTYDAAVDDEDEEGRHAAIDAAFDIIVQEIIDRTTASW